MSAILMLSFTTSSTSLFFSHPSAMVNTAWLVDLLTDAESGNFLCKLILLLDLWRERVLITNIEFFSFQHVI